MLSPDRLARIAVASLSIQERLAAGLCAEAPPDPGEFEAKLGEWRNAGCDGDEGLFVERLARDGLDPAGVRRLLVG